MNELSTRADNVVHRSDTGRNLTETRMRSLAKALSWQIWGIVTMSALGFLFTGSLTASGTLAVASAALGFVCYLLHERLWAAVRWGFASNSFRPDTSISAKPGDESRTHPL